MSFLTSILGGPGRVKATDSASIADLIWGNREVKSGATVNVDTSLRVPAVLGCVRVISEDAAKVPLGVYQDMKDGTKRKATEHSLHRLLSRKPNPWMTSMSFRQTLAMHACLLGNGYAFINRVRGEVRELIPLAPSRVVVRQLGDMSLQYDISDSKGIIGTYGPREILHLRGPSWTAWFGLDMVRQAAEAIGLAIAAEETQARLHANGVQGGGILSTDQKLTPDTVKRLREQFSDTYGGAGLFKTKVLDAGLKFSTMMMTGVDAQHLETRRFQVIESCRIFRVHPMKVFEFDKSATYASVEQFAISHVQDTLLPWFVQMEQTYDAALLTEEELADGYYTHHSVQGLLRGDSTARSVLYKAAITDGWMTRNEVRLLEELNPIPELDKPLKPLNMETVGQDAEDDVADPAEVQDAPAGADVVGSAAVQDTALNGDQVASLLAIIEAVAAGTLPADTARAMIRASFPAVSTETIDSMLAGLEGFEPPAPPAPEPPAA